MKKFLALVTLVCMVLVSTTAMAASVNSKQAKDLLSVADRDYSLEIAVETEKMAEEIAAMADYAVSNPSFAGYFNADVQKEIAENLKAETVVAYEVISVAAADYDEAVGEIEADFAFATVYADDAEVVVMIGFEGEDGIEWTAKKAVVVEGAVRVVFTAEEMVRMNSQKALVVVLSAPIV